MKLAAVIVAASITMSGMAVSAASPARPEVSAQVPVQEEPQRERRICRTEKMTGSLTRRTRICMTEAQWRELNARTRRGIEEMASSAAGGKECVQDEYGGCR